MMGIVSTLKSVLGGTKRQPETVEPRAPGLLEQLADAPTITPYVEHLRGLWLNGDGGTAQIKKQLIKAASKRFPQQDALIQLLRAIHGLRKFRGANDALFAYATSLTKTDNLAFEGYLYRSMALRDVATRRWIAASIRACVSAQPEAGLMRWYMNQLLRSCTGTLHRKAEKDLKPDDSAVALLLGFMTLSGSWRLLSPDWRDGVAARWPSCARRVAEESNWLWAASAELFEEAQRRALKGSLNPAFVARCRRVAGLAPGTDELHDLGSLVVRARTKGSTDPNFQRLEAQAHAQHMLTLSARLTLLSRNYQGCLGLIEWDAERAAMSGDVNRAVERFKELLSRKPDNSYYAYRAGCVLADAGRREEAYPWWLHAARTPGNGWRSRLACIAAVAPAYDAEALKLWGAPEHLVPRVAAALAAWLEVRMEEAWELSHWTAACALTAKAAQLYHLAAAREHDREKQQQFLEKAQKLYLDSDYPEGMNASEPSPTWVYQSIYIPLTVAAL